MQDIQIPRHRMGAAALAQDDRGRVLLVRTIDRADTWELPGGLVEEGEPPHLAAERETLEETGFRVEVVRLTGVYFNVGSSVVALMFRARLLGGEIRPQAAEILEVQFAELDRVPSLVTRPAAYSRVADALRDDPAVAYEVWRRDPMQRLSRLGPQLPSQ
jgi:8-oxo-dGTP diphosphatase